MTRLRYTDAMKVIMLKDVGGVGQRGALVNVADGYALNFLIPRGAAEQATADKIAQLEKRRASDAVATAERDREWVAHAERLEAKYVTIIAKANDAGHLYQ